MKLVDHARTELQKAGWFNEDGMYDGLIGIAVMELIRVFAQQGHSGMSASIVRGLFDRVAAFEPILPLTGEEDEWIEVGEVDGEMLYQNCRCHRVFKKGDLAYDAEGKVFRDPEDGVSYTNKNSCVPVKFPYRPKTEIVEETRKP